MPHPPKLTDQQRTRLKTLEPSLRQAVRLGDLNHAKLITKEIQDLLRPTGHETRLMKAKNWLFEAALNAGDIDMAVQGFIGVRSKTNPGTRVYLEATALLAIAYLRIPDMESAKPLMEIVLNDETSISSKSRRRMFRRRIIERFNEESALAALRGTGNEQLDPDAIENAAGALLQTDSEDDLLVRIGAAIPEYVILQIIQTDQLSRKALPYHEVKLLPDPALLKQKDEIGKTVFSSIKTVLYRSLCDPKSEIYQVWTKEGVGAVLNKKFIGAAVAAACYDLRIGLTAIAAPVAALIFRFGIDVYCDRFQPRSVMIDHAIEKE